MKYITIIVLFLSYLTPEAYCQETQYKDTFVRIYNLSGKKTHKGKIKSISNTSIELNLSRRSIKIPLEKIGKIKTKRSSAHYIIKSALITGGIIATMGFISGNDKGDGCFYLSAVDKAVIGFAAGNIIGGIVGAINVLFKKSEVFIINGNNNELKKFKEKMIQPKLSNKE